jgi:RimJ/RimL family protein N-acetyltransferase
MIHRLAVISDAKDMTHYRNVNAHCFFGGEVSLEETIDFLEQSERDPYDLTFIIEEDLCGVMFPVGQFSVYNIREGDMAECGRLIRYSIGSGFSTECLRIVEEVARLYNLKYVTADVMGWNKKSLVFFSKLGFRVQSTCMKLDGVDYFTLIRNFQR